jgi:hypothetical protein
MTTNPKTEQTMTGLTDYTVDPVTGTKLNLVPVHKENEEGVLLIDGFSGRVAGDPMERPEWAAGLVLALLGDRHEFYVSRLGPLYTDSMRIPSAYNVEDLDWRTIEEDGQTEGSIEHDSEFRMEVMATAAGITRTNDPEQAIHANVEREVTISRDTLRTEEEVSAFNKAQDEAFEKAAAVGGSKAG